MNACNFQCTDRFTLRILFNQRVRSLRGGVIYLDVYALGQTDRLKTKNICSEIPKEYITAEF